jgi:hypothetical protein
MNFGVWKPLADMNWRLNGLISAVAVRKSTKILQLHLNHSQNRKFIKKCEIHWKKKFVDSKAMSQAPDYHHLCSTHH